MEISVKWLDGKYPSFNIGLSSAAGKDPFIEIKGCKIMNGSSGEFISYPSKKNEQTGKYWNHVYGSPEFNEAVMKKALASKPTESENKPVKKSYDDFADDLPFN